MSSRAPIETVSETEAWSSPFFVWRLLQNASFRKKASLGNLVALIESFTSDSCMLDLVRYLWRTGFRKYRDPTDKPVWLVVSENVSDLKQSTGTYWNGLI